MSKRNSKFADIYTLEDGSKAKDVRIWDAYKHIAYINKSERNLIKVDIATRDGVRYLVFQECMDKQDGSEPHMMRGCLTIPLYMPIKQGTELIKPYIDFINAFQIAVAEHDNLPLEDPETAIFVTKKLYTEGERNSWKKLQTYKTENE